MIRYRSLITAFVLSAAVHIGAAALTLRAKPELEIAGGGDVEFVVLGQSPFTEVIAGTVDSAEASEAVETLSAVQPTEIETVTPVRAAEAVRIQPVKPVKTTAALTLPSLSPSAIAIPVAQDKLKELSALKTSPAKILKTDTAEPVKSSSQAKETPAKEVAAVTPVPSPAAKPVNRPETTEPVKQHTDNKPVERKKSTSKQTKKTAAKASNASRSGAGGNSNRMAQKGGSQNEGKAKTAGNSDVTNYPAKIYRKLLRSVRSSGGRKARRDAHVRFTVKANGSVASVSLIRSSGSEVFDQAVLRAVRSAAPYPQIPSEAKRSKWTFTLPVGN